MAWSLVANNSAIGATESLVTVTVNSVGANLTTVIVSRYNANSAQVEVFDTQLNTYTRRDQGVNNNVTCDLWDCVAPTTNAAQVISVRSTGGGGPAIYASVMVACWSGADATPFDTTTTGTGGGTNQVTLGTLTPAAAGELFITGVVFEDNSSGAVSINSSFTITDTEAYSGGLAEGGSLAYFINSGSSGLGPTWDVTNAPSVLAAVMGAYKVAAGGGGATWPGYIAPFGWK